MTIGPLLEPAPLWMHVGERVERGGWMGALVGLAVVGGLVIAVATEFGVRVFNTDWNDVAGYSTDRGRTWLPFLTLWFAASLLPIVQGLCAAWLLPLYGRARAWRRALAVSVIGSVPLYAAGVTLVVLPGIMVVCVAFLVSLAWWGSGVRLLLGLPYGEAADHLAVSLVASAVLVSIALAVATAT